MGLGFLSPLFLLGAVAAAVPILVHLFRRRADPVVPFSAVRFLRHAPVERARRRRIRDVVLLALRVAATVLLALSFARPYIAASAAAPAAPLTIIALDRSYSMSSPPQVRRARELARAAVHDAPAGGLVSLVSFDEVADVIVGATRDRGAVSAAIDRWEPGMRGTRYGSALASAADVASGRPAHVVVVSDLQQRGWATRSSAALPPSAIVTATDAGGSGGDLAVVSLSRAPGGAAATVRNLWTSRKAVRVRFSVDGRELGAVPADVPPGATVTAHLAASLPARGVLRAALDDRDGYAADDERYLVLDAAARPRVVVVRGEGRLAASSLYLEAALTAVNRDEFDIVRWSPRGQSAAPWDGSAAVVLLGTYGIERSALESMWRATTAGTGLLVAAGPAIEASRLHGVLPIEVGPSRTADGPPLSLAPVDVRHLAFRSLQGDAGWLASVRFATVAQVDEAKGTHVLARFSDGSPALLEHDGPGRVLVFASDLSNEWNDFARHPAFVPFVHDVVGYAASPTTRAGEVIVGTVPGATRPGTIEVGGTRVAVNVDPAEAERARMSPAAFVAAVPRSTEDPVPPERRTAVRRESDQSLWRYGLVLMLAALVIESAVGRKV